MCAYMPVNMRFCGWACCVCVERSEVWCLLKIDNFHLFSKKKKVCGENLSGDQEDLKNVADSPVLEW